MGICPCFLKIAMMQKGYELERTLITQENFNLVPLKIATYNIKLVVK